MFVLKLAILFSILITGCGLINIGKHEWDNGTGAKTVFVVGILLIVFVILIFMSWW